jgi:hypothetical protein
MTMDAAKAGFIQHKAWHWRLLAADGYATLYKLELGLVLDSELVDEDRCARIDVRVVSQISARAVLSKPPEGAAELDHKLITDDAHPFLLDHVEEGSLRGPQRQALDRRGDFGIRPAVTAHRELALAQRRKPELAHSRAEGFDELAFRRREQVLFAAFDGGLGHIRVHLISPK